MDTRGDLARCSSNQVALEPFRTPASAQASSDRLRRLASLGPYLRVAFGEGICGAGSASVRWGSAPRSQTPSVDFHPRARGDLPRSSSQLGSNGISPRARFASWRWLSLRLFSLLLRAKCGLSASSGETWRHSSPKRARRSEAGNSCRPNSAAPVFRLAAGVSPSNQETDKPAHPKPVRRRASRLGRPTLRFGYSRANRDSEGHLQGRPARSARIVPHPA